MSVTRKIAALAAMPLLVSYLAQAQEPIPPPSGPPAVQTTDPRLQFVNQIMQTAMAVEGLVKTMNLGKTFGVQSAYPPGDPRSLQRTAEFMGVGAGVGMALGEMNHSQKGAIIGAAAGSAGGLIVDQILRHQAAKAQTGAGASPPASSSLQRR